MKHFTEKLANLHWKLSAYDEYRVKKSFKITLNTIYNYLLFSIVNKFKPKYSGIGGNCLLWYKCKLFPKYEQKINKQFYK